MRVEVSERELIRLQDRIDWDAAQADGFVIVVSAPNIVSGAVELDVITWRSDHREYFRGRYGPRVVARVIATELTSPECAGISHYHSGPDGMSVTVAYESGGGAEFDRAELLETEDRVEVGIIVRAPNGPRTDDSRIREHTVALSRPLGGRRVVDATTGRTLPAREP